MTTHQHPLAFVEHPTFDILHGITAEQNISETIEIGRQKIARTGEPVLYINTLSSAAAVESECADLIRSTHKEPLFYIGHFYRAEVATKLEFLSKTILARKIKTVIINSYEFAVSTSRHRSDLVVWMRAMRDEHGVQVILSMMTAPGQAGLQQVIRFMSDSISRIGEYQVPGQNQRKLEFLSFREYAKKSMEAHEKKLATQAEINANEVDETIAAETHITEDADLVSSITSEGALLRNKDLPHAFVSRTLGHANFEDAHEEELEEEIEYA